MTPVGLVRDRDRSHTIRKIKGAEAKGKVVGVEETVELFIII